VAATLYVTPASHPSVTAALMLERKGIPYKRRDLVPVISKGVLRAARFPGVTVPALKLDGRRIQGSREIARELDRVQPEPPLFPANPSERAAVEEVEEWGDVFQQ
jgi:glutathione S-transferase